MKIIFSCSKPTMAKQLLSLNNRSIIQAVRYASDFPFTNFIDETDTAGIKAGKGGRSSFSGQVVTALGAHSFLGKAVVQKLGKCGTQCLIPYREYDTYRSREFRVMGDLGQMLLTRFELFDDDSLRKCFRHCDTIINFIGPGYEYYKGHMEKVNVHAARRVAKIAKEMGVKNLIHMSALNSNIKHEGFLRKGGSIFYETKGRGERAVLEEFPDAIVIRPSAIFGAGDGFLHAMMFKHRLNKFYNKLYLPNRGVGIYKQPVYVHDLARAIVKICMEPHKHRGMIYEAVGPRRYEMKDIGERVLELIRLTGYTVGDSRSPWYRLKVKFFEREPIGVVPRHQWMNYDMIEREATTDITCGLPTLSEIGIENLTPMDDVMAMLTYPFKRGLFASESTMDIKRYPPMKHVECPTA